MVICDFVTIGKFDHINQMVTLSLIPISNFVFFLVFLKQLRILHKAPLNAITFCLTISDNIKQMITLTKYTFILNKPIPYLRGLAQTPLNDDYIILITLSVITLCSAHCSPLHDQNLMPTQ
jgi:hypothetical protein